MPNIFSQLIGPDTSVLWLTAREHVLSSMHWLAPYSTVLSLLLIVGVVYCFLRIEHIVRETKHEDVPHGGHGHGGGHGASEQSQQQKRWERVQAHVASERESDWRLAILEADVLLDEMVTHMGYHGDSLGEKLKAIEKSDFTSLDAAWEAHAVRNKIAHEGAAFTLTEREAKRIVDLYEAAFKEFQYI